MSDPAPHESFNRARPSIDGDAGARRQNRKPAHCTASINISPADYAQAIDIWTRALFLDRQSRARAAIDRARSAMAEQQRESEELLQRRRRVRRRGEIEAARQMLNAAVQRGGAHDVALAFSRDRSDPCRHAGGGPRRSRLHRACRSALARSRPRSWPRWRCFSLSDVLLAATGHCLSPLPSDGIREWDGPGVDAGRARWSRARARGAGAVNRPRSSRPLIARCARSSNQDTHMMLCAGRHRCVRAADPLRAEADNLKAAIQRELLTFQTSTRRRRRRHRPLRHPVHGTQTMKCPKCGYLAFESGDRCRHCGSDGFPLTAGDPDAFDLPLDLGPDESRPPLDLDRIIGAPEPAPPGDLPLFGGEDALLIRAAAPRPRAPISVCSAQRQKCRARARPTKTSTSPEMFFETARRRHRPFDAALNTVAGGPRCAAPRVSRKRLSILRCCRRSMR